jgi:pimeloyl-ACP methyl ester carboxylesterase
MNATALVLAPGLMCDPTVWQAQIAAFETQMPVQVIDYGLLDSLPAMAAHLLQQAPPRFALAGHSMGGRVALEVMRLAPERVSHLALLDTGCHALPKGEAAEKERYMRLGFLHLAQEKGVMAMARSWLRSMVHPDRLSDAPLIDAIVSMFARRPVEVYAAQIKALLARPEAFPVLAQIRCPTLVLCGNEDTNSPPAANLEMAGAIVGDQLDIIPHCGHMAPMERPEAVNDALRNLLVR